VLVQVAARNNVDKSARSFRGDRLRLIREKKGMSQEELEKFLNFGKGSISRYENGDNDPLPNQLVEMSRKLQVSVDWLLGLSDDPETSLRRNDLTTEEVLLLTKYRSGELEKLAHDILGEALAKKSPRSSNPTNPKGSHTNAA
jgi:repressor LexA